MVFKKKKKITYDIKNAWTISPTLYVNQTCNTSHVHNIILCCKIYDIGEQFSLSIILTRVFLWQVKIENIIENISLHFLFNKSYLVYLEIMCIC